MTVTDRALIRPRRDDVAVLIGIVEIYVYVMAEKQEWSGLEI